MNSNRDNKAYIDVWIQYAMAVRDPLTVFNYMKESGIGIKDPRFYVR